MPTIIVDAKDDTVKGAAANSELPPAKPADASPSVVNVLRELKRCDERPSGLPPTKKSRMEESAGVSSSAASPPKVDDPCQPPTLLQPAVALPSALTNGNSFENSVSSFTPRSPALTPTQRR